MRATRTYRTEESEGEAVLAEDAAGASGVMQTCCCGGEAVVEAEAECGALSLDTPLAATVRTWKVLVDAGCSLEEPIDAITTKQTMR